MNNTSRNILRVLCFILLPLGLLHSEVTSPGVSSEPADTIRENPNKITIEFVTVGDPGNAARKKTSKEPYQFGAVATAYQIGKYEVKAREYCAFLNAVAAVDTYHLYDDRMSSDDLVAVIDRKQTKKGYQYQLKEGRGDFPITYVSWFEAARFCNWIHNGQPIGPQGPKTTEEGAYNIDGANIFKINVDHSYCAVNPGAVCFIPSEDQWYKAAYYKGGSAYAGYWMYPTQSDDPPGNDIGDQPNQANYKNNYHDETKNPALTPVNAFTGSCSYYAAFDMGGNVWEWNDTPCFTPGEYKILLYGVRGGAWDSVKKIDEFFCYLSDNDDLRRDKEGRDEQCDEKKNNLGFRVAAPIPPLNF